jgi:hypothetical protein
MILDQIVAALRLRIDRMRYYDDPPMTVDELNELALEIDSIADSLHDDCPSEAQLDEKWDEGFTEGFNGAIKLVIKKVLENPELKKRGEMIAAAESLEESDV